MEQPNNLISLEDDGRFAAWRRKRSNRLLLLEQSSVHDTPKAKPGKLIELPHAKEELVIHCLDLLEDLSQQYIYVKHHKGWLDDILVQRRYKDYHLKLLGYSRGELFIFLYTFA
jgi:hypothetical protein